MPRIRTVKPEFWTSGQVLECSTNARLMFIGLWNFCDDTGRHPLKEKQIKAEIFPADDFTIDDIRGMIQELSENALITTYIVDNNEFLQVNGWHHQRIDKPQPSKYPEPIQEHSKNDSRTFPPDRKGKDSKGEERIGNEGNGKTLVESASGPDRDVVNRIFAFWQETHNHPKAKLDDKRRKKIKARLADGYTEDDLLAAIRGCKKSPHHMGENDNGTVYDDLELICRDGPHVDKFIRLDSEPDKTRMSGSARKTSSAAQKWLEAGHAEQR